MYKVIKNEEIKNNIYLLEIENELIAKKFVPGEFIILMSHEKSERIPLTIFDVKDNIVRIVYQVVGASTLELSNEKESIFSIVGPLGNGSEIVANYNEYINSKIVFVAGGIGVAAIYPQAKALFNAGIDVDIVYGVKNQDLILFEEELKKVCNNLIIATDDGSRGIKGNVCDALRTLDKEYDVCIAIGPIIMMKFVSLETKKMNLKTIVSMNPIMVDGTGMCGACRLNVGGNIKFACVDGPEFDGHLVDFDNLLTRMNLYKDEEGRKYLRMIEGKTHHGGCGNCGEENE